LFVPVSVIVDLCADPTNHDLPQPTREAISAHHHALQGWFERAASWVRSGERAKEVIGGLPEPPVLSGLSDQVPVLGTWYGLLRQDSRNSLSEVGPQPE